MRIEGRLGIGVAMPSIAVAGGNSFNPCAAMIDGKVEGVDIGAAGTWLCVVVGIDA